MLKRSTHILLAVMCLASLIAGSFMTKTPQALAANDPALNLKPDSASIPQSYEAQRDAYFLTLLGGKEPATDSASAATAISTGYKTDDGNIAWKPGDPVGGNLTTIAETLRSSNGFAIGVASTVQFSHATPASFVSHNVNRNNYSQIALEILNTVQPDVVIGGGHPIYYAATPNYSFVGDQATWDALVSGTTPDYTLVQRQAGVDGGDALLAAASATNLSSGDKLLGVFGGPGGNFEYNVPAHAPGSPSVAQGSTENPTLADVTNASLSVLSQDPDGLFIMFEQGDIDWSNHANNYRDMVGGIWDLDQAVRAAESFIDQAGGPEWSDTLVMVTSDHSNSYMRLQKWLDAGALPQQTTAIPPAYPDGEVTYGSANHTNELVTLWARGQGASLFNDVAGTWYPETNIVDNSQIYDVMRRAVQDESVKHVILFIGDGMNIEHEIAGSRYLYGEDMGLAWHDWRLLADGWGGYCSTWDMTTYNKYAAAASAPAYVAPATPADLGANDASFGYDVVKGGTAPYRLQSAYAIVENDPAYLYAVLAPGETTTTSLTITKRGSANPAWNLVETPAIDWLAAAQTSGVLINDGSLAIPITLDASGLTPDFYKSNLSFHTSYGELSIPVVLKVATSGSAPAATDYLDIQAIGTYTTNEETGAEIVTYDPAEQYLYVTNGFAKTVDVLSIANLATDPNPVFVKSIDITPYGDGVTSVDIKNGILAAAVPAAVKTDPGKVVLFQGNDAYAYTVGALPDMVTFSPDGNLVLSANEGEPNDDYTIDPHGSISILDISAGIDQAVVTTLDFTGFTDVDPQIRIFGKNASIAQDMEPEYITVSDDSSTAWVTLQENNAMAVIDLNQMEIASLVPFGLKDWSNLKGLDASDKDSQVNITNWPILGMYMPDGIASYKVNGTPYLVTANEGDSRDYDGFSEEARLGSVTLDPVLFPHASELQKNTILGRLKITIANNTVHPEMSPDQNGDGKIDTIYAYGARSFSIWNGETGALVYDSGDDFERITAALIPDLFNADSGDPAQKDTRSDDKGPEAESVTLGTILGHTYAFISFERSGGGVIVYDVTDPSAPVFVTYAPADLGDISPEGLKFIPAAVSPNGKNLIVIANEISGSTTVYQIVPPTMTIYLPAISSH